MLEKWGYFNSTGFDGMSWGGSGDCLIEVYDADFYTDPAVDPIGWSASGSDRECYLEGRNLIEDIE